MTPRCKQLFYGLHIVLFTMIVGTALPAEEKPGDKPDRVLEITGTEYQFKPDKFTVKAGETVKIVFKNKGTISHDFFIKELDFQTDPIQPGNKVNYTFTAPESSSTLHFECKVAGHAPAGMKGTIQVKNDGTDASREKKAVSKKSNKKEQKNDQSASSDPKSKPSEAEKLTQSLHNRMAERRQADLKSGWGVVTGTVKLSGEKPAPYKNPGTKAFEKQCGFEGAIEIQYVQVNQQTKGIQDTLVYVETVDAVHENLLPPKQAKVLQKHCRFHPHVQVVRTGGTLELLNSDPAVHNFNYKPTSDNNFVKGNIVQQAASNKPKQDQIDVGTTDVYSSQCNVHPWMNGMFLAIDHHGYDVTGKKGTYRIQLPPGTYTLHVRHYTQKKAKTVQVTVPKGDEKQKNISLRLK